MALCGINRLIDEKKKDLQQFEVDAAQSAPRRIADDVGTGVNI
jgi:hypothetical protein